MRGSSGIVHGCRDKELRQWSGGFAAGGRVLGLREDGRLQRCCGLLVQNQRRNLICLLLPFLSFIHQLSAAATFAWIGASGPEHPDRSAWTGASGPERLAWSVWTGVAGSQGLDQSPTDG